MQITDQLDTTRDETLRHFQLGEQALASRYAPDRWPIRFILHHLADAETVMFERIRSETGLRTLKEEFDKVAWHNEHHLGQIRAALGRP